MRAKIGLLTLLSVLILSGQGCFGFGGGTDTSGRDGGVWKSVDRSATWSQTNTVLSSKGVGSLMTANIQTMVFDPQDNKTIYAGLVDTGFVYTYDGGTSWYQSRDAVTQSGTVRSIAVDPKDQCTLYFTSGTRAYRSDNCGRNFKSVYDEARSGVSTRQIAVDDYDTNIVYVALSNGDVLKSSDKGEHWSTSLMSKMSISQLIISNQDSRIILVAGEDGVYKSVDSGASWTQLVEPFKSYQDSTNIFTLIQSADGGTLYVSSKYGLLRSTDLAESWEALTLLTAPGQVTVRALAIDPNDTNKVYYATATTFYESTDGGANWNTAKLPTTRSASFLTVDPKDGNTVYMGTLKLEK